MKDIRLPSEFASELAPFLESEERVVSIEWKNVQNSTPTTGGSPPPANQANAVTGPLEIRVEFSFDGQYQDIEALTRTAKIFIASLQQKMPGYAITTEPYPWLRDSNKNMEVSLDQVQVSSPIPEGTNKLVVIFHGPRKVDAKSAPNAKTPVPAPATGMPR